MVKSYSWKNLVVGFVILAALFVMVQTYLSSPGQRVPSLESKAVVAVEAAKTPFKFWVNPSRDYIAGMRQNPVPPETVAYLEGLAKISDMVVPLRATYTANGKLEYANWNYPILKGINPDMYVMEYANPRNWAGNIFRLSEIPESWFLHDPVGCLKIECRVLTFWWTIDPNPNNHNEWVFDMGNPDFISFFANKVVYALQQGLDGLWMDNAGITTDQYVMKVKRFSDGQIVNPINPRTGKSYTAAEQHVEYIDVARAVRETVDKAFPSSVSKNGLPILLAPNVAADIITPEWEVVSLYGSVMSEGSGWFAHSEMSKYSQTRWLRDLNNLQETMRRKLPFVYVGKPYEDTANPWPGKSRLIFTYASALLGAGAPGDRVYFRYNFGGYESWSGFNVDLGFANGEYFKWPGTNNVYARWFGRALVLVNPSAAGETVNPGVSYRPFVDYSDKNGKGGMNWQGLGSLASGSMFLPGYEAAILTLEQIAPTASATRIPTRTPTRTPTRSTTPTRTTTRTPTQFRTPTLPPTSITPVILSGDINTDGKVDALDYVLLFESFARRAGDAFYNPKADIAPSGGDGIVNALDYVVLFENFGRMK